MQPNVAVVLGLVQARERIKEPAGRERAIERVERFALCYRSACESDNAGMGDKLNSRTACRASTDTSCTTPVRK